MTALLVIMSMVITGCVLVGVGALIYSVFLWLLFGWDSLKRMIRYYRERL